MKNKLWLTLIACALTSAFAFAQAPGPGKPGGAERKDPGASLQKGERKALGEISRPITPLALIRRPAVQQELALTPAQLNALQERLRALRPDPNQKTRGRNPAETLEKAEGIIKEVLTPQQIKRLEEISLQLEGPRALLRPEIADKVGLSPQQREKIREIYRNVGRPTTPRDVPQGPEGREQLRERMKAQRKELEEKLLGVLTPEQRTRWQALLGRPFERKNR
ncbi:MAG TPA: hypothetical protein VNK96_02315 [Fimbriimonadales bacterium]|nr:hypothetical protein [Fimbriimonadales bacterium]